jgi:hypothetical protein
MGQATTLILRERVLELRAQGETIKRIGEELSMPFSTVKKLCRRFRDMGPSGLQPSYSNCGTKTAGRLKGQKAEAVRQRELHPGWGAPRIQVELARGLPSPDGELASVRTMQRWYRSAGLYTPRRQGCGPAIGRSTAPHNIWEVDAKENLALEDGSPACYLTIGDEKTGAWLEAVVFPPQEDKPSAARRGAESPLRDI